MSMRTKAALAAATAFMLAGAVQAAPPTPTFLMKAGASDLYERTASEVVLGSTHNPRVRRFANMMVKDHSKSTAMVKAAAMRSGMHPRPPMLDWRQKNMVAELRHSNGRMRDRLYVSQQKRAHAEALSLMREYATTGADRPLRRAASNIVPVIRHHIRMLNGM